MLPRPSLEFASPRKLPKAKSLRGNVVVLDIAFASEAGGGFEKTTKPLIDGLGPRLRAWVDHHDHLLHATYRSDPRFVLATKQEHPACPEMVTPELVEKTGPIETIVCHSDFDGLCSAAKWIREGIEPYPGADADARAIDTRIGQPSVVGDRIDRALRVRSRDMGFFGLVVSHLASGLADASLSRLIEEAAREFDVVEKATRTFAKEFRSFSLSLATSKAIAKTGVIMDATAHRGKYDKWLLLLLGQEKADVALLIDTDTLSLAAPFDSGVDFLDLLGLSGGMPTLVSVDRGRLGEALQGMNVMPNVVADLMSLYAKKN